MNSSRQEDEEEVATQRAAFGAMNLVDNSGPAADLAQSEVQIDTTNADAELPKDDRK